MRLFKNRRSAIAAIALLAGGATGGQALASSGGLSVSPGILEHVASPGSVGALKISNTTSGSMTVKLALRPWVQASSGEVSPNRRATLPGVQLAASSFTLAAGASRSVPVSLARRPRGGSLYGGIEVTGAPGGRAGNGIKIAYRLVDSLRLDPPHGQQVFRVKTGKLVQEGNTRQGTLLLAVRNTGNTILPIGGKVRISGHGRSLSSTASAKAIVPGQTVNVLLAQLLKESLKRGRYMVTVALTQAGHSLGTLTQRFYLF